MTYSLLFKVNNEPWNKGMIVGPKPPLKLKEVWSIRIRLQISGDVRNGAQAKKCAGCEQNDSNDGSYIIRASCIS